MTKAVCEACVTHSALSSSLKSQKVASGDTTSYGFLQELDNGINNLGLTDRVVGMSTYNSDACSNKARTECNAGNNLCKYINVIYGVILILLI